MIGMSRSIPARMVRHEPKGYKADLFAEKSKSMSSTL